MTTLESIVGKVPTLAVAGAVVVAVFVLLILGAVVSHWRDRRRKTAARHEPDFDEAAKNDVDDLVPVYGPAPPPPPPPPMVRRGFGFAALTVAFVVGLLVGMAAMTTARHEIAAGLTRLAALIRNDTDQPATGPGETSAPPRVATSVADPAADVGARLAAFAASLKASLPRPAGADLSLNRVAVDGTVLDLGYAVGRVLPPDEIAPFKAYLERTTRSLFCAEEASEIRYLSRNGVVFHMVYRDPSGAMVSEITVTPAFCG